MVGLSNIVYSPSRDNNPELFYALDGSDGSVLWSKGIDAVASVLNEEGDVMYVTASASDDSVLGYDPITGNFFGDYVVPNKDDITSLPLVGEDGNVYFGTETMHVVALSPTGQLLWTSTEQEEDMNNYGFYRSFASTATSLYVGACDGTMRAYPYLTMAPTAAPTEKDPYAPTVAPTALTLTQSSYTVDYQSNSASLLGGDYSSLEKLDMEDDAVATLKLPFPFSYFAVEYGYAYLSSNGLLSFSHYCDEDMSNCDAPISGNYARRLFARNVEQSAETSRRNLGKIKQSKEYTSNRIVFLKRSMATVDMTELIKTIRSQSENSDQPDFSATVRTVFSSLRAFVLSDISATALSFLQSDYRVFSLRQDREVQVLDPRPAAMKGVQAVGSSETYSWGLDRIDQKDLPLDGSSYEPPSATQSGRGANIYILDTGIDTNHAAFTNLEGSDREVVNIYNGYGDISADTDGDGHGTHCAGTAGGVDIGVAPEANVYGVKILNDSGGGYISVILAGMNLLLSIREANQSLPMVASMSIGVECDGACEEEEIYQAVEELSAAGITVVASAGNDNEPAVGYVPRGAPSAFVVGATNIDDEKADYSNYGSNVDIQAPGSDINSACAASQCGGSESMYVEYSGTSMATPHVRI